MSAEQLLPLTEDAQPIPVVDAKPEDPAAVQSEAKKEKRKRKKQKVTGYEDVKVDELKAQLKSFNVEGISRMPKDSLIALLVYNKKKAASKEKKVAKKQKVEEPKAESA
jgi:hypothetical protein